MLQAKTHKTNQIIQIQEVKNILRVEISPIVNYLNQIQLLRSTLVKVSVV